LQGYLRKGRVLGDRRISRGSRRRDLDTERAGTSSGHADKRKKTGTQGGRCRPGDGEPSPGIYTEKGSKMAGSDGHHGTQAGGSGGPSRPPGRPGDRAREQMDGTVSGERTDWRFKFGTQPRGPAGYCITISYNDYIISYYIILYYIIQNHIVIARGLRGRRIVTRIISEPASKMRPGGAPDTCGARRRLPVIDRDGDTHGLKGFAGRNHSRDEGTP
jgi:hypothetical protein